MTMSLAAEWVAMAFGSMPLRPVPFRRNTPGRGPTDGHPSACATQEDAVPWAGWEASRNSPT